jgi:hypothetical protein
MASRLQGMRLAPIAAACLVGCGGGAAAVSTCATKATPDLSVQGAFDVDTGLPSSSTVGAGYGQSLCEGQYLVEADLQQQASDFVVSALWSSVVPATPCDVRSTMNVFVFDGASWQSWDVVSYAGKADGGVCGVDTLSHTNAGSEGLDATNIPAARHFQRARIAARATEAGAAVPVAVVGLFR